MLFICCSSICCLIDSLLLNILYRNIFKIYRDFQYNFTSNHLNEDFIYVKIIYLILKNCNK